MNCKMLYKGDSSRSLKCGRIYDNVEIKIEGGYIKLIIPNLFASYYDDVKVFTDNWKEVK